LNASDERGARCALPSHPTAPSLAILPSEGPITGHPSRGPVVDLTFYLSHSALSSRVRDPRDSSRDRGKAAGGGGGGGEVRYGIFILSYS